MGSATSTAVVGLPSRIRQALSPQEWGRLGLMVVVILGLYAVGGALLAAAVPRHYHLSGTGMFGFGTGALALTLGMRHAFDADHISAIDNTTRKLMTDGQRPTSVGFFFALGHASVVLVLAVLLGVGVRTVNSQVSDNNSTLHSVAGVVGTSASGMFLYAIAALNMVILSSILRIFLGMRRGIFDEENLESQLDQRGLMNRFLAPLARRVDTPWKMYPLGVLFGLGFDTATEVALLVLSGSAVANGLPFYAVLSLPLLFAAGMATFDTIDGCFMNFAYGWAFSRPVRKVYYNLIITGLSVVAAFVIGTIELLGLLPAELKLHGSFWSFTEGFDINTAGFIIVGLFILTWVVALAVWRLGRLEQRWAEAASRS